MMAKAKRAKGKKMNIVHCQAMNLILDPNKIGWKARGYFLTVNIKYY
jgi:hypothetical protein